MVGVLGMVLWWQGVAVGLEEWGSVELSMGGALTWLHTEHHQALQDGCAMVLLMLPAAAKLVGSEGLSLTWPMISLFPGDNKLPDFNVIIYSSDTTFLNFFALEWIILTL